MVEDDILDANPNVTFDSIAGLEEAKGLIQVRLIVRIHETNKFITCRKRWYYQ
jgi:hypothetical protein